MVSDSESVGMKTISMMMQLTQFSQCIARVHNYQPKDRINIYVRNVSKCLHKWAPTEYLTITGPRQYEKSQNKRCEDVILDHERFLKIISGIFKKYLFAGLIKIKMNIAGHLTEFCIGCKCFLLQYIIYKLLVKTCHVVLSYHYHQRQFGWYYWHGA